MRSVRILLAAVWASPCLAPAGAWAHAFAQRYDLPLPLWLYIAGAGAAVAATFLVAASFARAGGTGTPERRVTLPTVVVNPVRFVGVVAFALILSAGYFGEPVDWNRNLLPAAVWIGWWVGLAVVGALVGNLWPLIDPWQTVAAWSFARRPATRRLPEGLDAWPAVVLFFAFAWCELAWPDNAAPRKLAIVISAYSAAAWTVMAIFGAAAWRRHFDPFSRFFDLLGRFAPLAVGCDSAGRWSVTLRGYGAGLAHGARPSNAETAFVIVVLATVSFDGIAETPFWDAAVGHAIGRLYDAGVVGAVGYAASGAAIKTAGLALAPLIFGAVYLAVCAATARLGREPADAVARRHALTLVPIAIAYHLAHYLSYLLVQGQAIVPLLSDPLGRGWNLFGTRDFQPDLNIVGPRFVWIAAVMAIVLGHVASVVLAHRASLRAGAAHGQWPIAALMVAYTMLSLWILAQPIVSL